MKITESQLRRWLEAVTAGDMSFSRMAELINERSATYSDSMFFDAIKMQYGIDVPQKDRYSFLYTAGRELHDLRLLFRLHPDQEMVETSCLHFLGDEAQIWWANKSRALKPISELQNGIFDCQRILEFVFPGAKLTGRLGGIDEICISGNVNGNSVSVVVKFSGHVEFIQSRSSSDFPSIFALVDFIRSLGYDVK